MGMPPSLNHLNHMEGINNMANVVVTGARGTIGVPLVRALRKAGHNVFEIDLKHDNGGQYFRADISNYRELMMIMGYILQSLRKQNKGDIDYVYHLAAEFGRMNGEMYYERLWATNAIGTKNILSLQKAGLFNKLIFFSSSEVYGNSSDDVLTEDFMKTHQVVQHNDYAMSKWVNEMQIINHEALTGLPVMRLRLFNAYGEEEYYHPFRSVVCLFCYRALFNIPYEVYEGYHRVFMHVDDLTPTLVNCIGMFKPGVVVNVGGVEYRSVKDLSNIILNCVGKDDSLVTYLPEDAHNTVNKRPDISLAKELLQHNPTITLEQGVPKTIEWMKRTYMGE